MAFAQLPTELDTQILEYLYDDRPALSATSMASKYLRIVAEPILYRDLVLPQVTDVQIKWLLMTILDRKELAEHIQSINISIPGSTTDSVVGSTASTTFVEALPTEVGRRECRARLRCYTNKIRELLHGMRLFCPPNRFIEMWRRDILNDFIGVERDTHFDGALALLLTRATTLRTLQLATAYDNHMNICHTIVGLSWRFYNPTPTPCPFNNLENFCILPQDKAPGIPGCYFSVSVPRFVQNLQLAGCSLTLLKALDPVPLALQILDLRDAYIFPGDLIKSLSTGKFVNLRRLNLDGIRDPPGRSSEMLTWEGLDNSFDCRDLTPVLCIYTPQLEKLSFRSRPCVSPVDMWPLDFGSLKSLKKLRVLRIHIDRLIHGDGLDELEPYSPHLILPRALRRLEIVGLPISRINMYCARPAGIEKVASGMQFIVDATRSFPLESLEVGISKRGSDTDPGREDVILTGKAMKLLKDLVNESLKKGTVFRVYNGGQQKMPKCILFGTAGLHQSL